VNFLGPNIATGTNDAVMTTPAEYHQAKFPAPNATMLIPRPPSKQYRMIRNFIEPPHANQLKRSYF